MSTNRERSILDVLTAKAEENGTAEKQPAATKPFSLKVVNLKTVPKPEGTEKTADQTSKAIEKLPKSFKSEKTPSKIESPKSEKERNKPEISDKTTSNPETVKPSVEPKKSSSVDKEAKKTVNVDKKADKTDKAGNVSEEPNPPAKSRGRKSKSIDGSKKSGKSKVDSDVSKDSGSTANDKPIDLVGNEAVKRTVSANNSLDAQFASPSTSVESPNVVRNEKLFDNYESNGDCEVMVFRPTMEEFRGNFFFYNFDFTCFFKKFQR